MDASNYTLDFASSKPAMRDVGPNSRSPTAAINSRLREREDEAGRGCARVPVAVDVDDEGLRDAYLADGATPVLPCGVAHRLDRA